MLKIKRRMISFITNLTIYLLPSAVQRFGAIADFPGAVVPDLPVIVES